MLSASRVVCLSFVLLDVTGSPPSGIKLEDGKLALLYDAKMTAVR